MDQRVNKSKIISSLFWKLLERGGVQGIQIVVQLVLARLLLPEYYGLIALVTIFISLANVFVQSGFNKALIQKKDADEIDFSSVFYLSLLIAGILYVLIYLTAPYIAHFYQSPQLIPLLRVFSITLFIGAFNSIQNAYVAKNMIFKKLFFSSLGSVLISGTVGLTTALLGWGVWALVAQQLTNQLSITIILFFTVKWRPRLVFSIEKVKVLFSYGWKLLVSSLLETLYVDIRTLVIGRLYSPAMLGFYNRGNQFPRLIVNNIDGSIKSVMLPALANHQDNLNRVKSMMRRAIVTSSFIMFPVMIGFAVVAEPVVKIILTDKWLPAVPFLQIFCGVYALRPIHSTNLQAINALGRSDIYLKLEIIKKVLGLAILVISLPFGIYAIAWGMLISSFLSTFINAYPNQKLLNYSYLQQWKDIMPALLISMIMGAIVHSFIYLNISYEQVLILQVISGIIIYIGLAKISRLESFAYLIETFMEIYKGRRGVS